MTHSAHCGALPRARTFAVAALAALTLAAGVPAVAAADWRVGHDVQNIALPGTGARNVAVHLWYPADAADWNAKPLTSYSSVYRGAELPESSGFSPLSWSFDAELAHEAAAVASDGPAFPVIVFSHGSVNDPINSSHLLERIAADGFIVAAPTHWTDTHEDVRMEFIHGRLGAAGAAQLPADSPFRKCLNGQNRVPTPGQPAPLACSRPNNTGQARMVERHTDLVNTLDALPGWLGGRADMSKVGVFGHSRGTLTGLTAAGGSPGAWTGVTTPPTPSWSATPDARVKAVMGMASGGAQQFTLTANLAAIDIPTLIVAGGLDNNSPMPVNVDLYNQIGCEEALPLAAPTATNRPAGCASPKASKELWVLDQAHHRTFIGTFCDQTRATGTIAKAHPAAVFEIGALTGANGAQFLTQANSGRAMDYCSPDTFAGWEDLVRSTTAPNANPALAGFCISPATVDPGTPCTAENGAVPTTGYDEETAKQQLSAKAIEFFTDKLARDRDGDGIADMADNCLTAANSDQADTDDDGTGNVCDQTPYGTVAPELTIPADFTVDATGPSGATVTFTATATDDLDTSPAVTCAPASGSVFAIAATQVTCTATDNGGNTSPPATFTVTVLGAGDQISALIADVVNATRLSAATKAQLTSALQSLVAGFDPNRPLQRAAACLTLRTFTTVVRVLAAANATEWIADANRIRAVLAC